MKLSNLQRTILALGLKSEGGMVTPAAVKIAYYGFSLWRPSSKCCFSRAGQKLKARHNAAGVCIARSFDRMTRKKLAVRHYGKGIVLTEVGKKTAEGLFSDNYLNQL